MTTDYDYDRARHIERVQEQFTKRVQSNTERVKACLEAKYTPLECNELVSRVSR